MKTKTNFKENLLIFLFVELGFLSFIANFSYYHLPGEWVISTAMLILVMLMSISDSQISSSKKKEAFVFGIAWTIVYMTSIIINNGIPDNKFFFYLIFGVLFLTLHQNMQVKVSRIFVWALSILLTLSIFEFILYEVLGYGVVLGNVVRETAVKDSYFVHLLFNVISYELLIPRFQSIAEEPGLVGTLCAFLLFLTSQMKNLKYPFYVFLISGILTFSLAFYAIAGFFFILNTKKIKHIFIVALIGGVVVFMVRDRFETLIIERIVDKNIEEIDDRSTERFDSYFDDASRRGNLWLGVGFGNLPGDLHSGGKGGVAGAKKWIYQYGFICFGIVFLTYNFLYFHRKKGKMGFYDWVFLIIFWLSYYQRQTIERPYTLLVYLALPLVTSVKKDARLHDREKIARYKNTAVLKDTEVF